MEIPGGSGVRAMQRQTRDWTDTGSWAMNDNGGAGNAPADVRASPDVFAVVLNWDGWRHTIECLESLQLLSLPLRRIVVVDNGSTDDSVEQIRAWARGDVPVNSAVLGEAQGAKPVVWVEYERSAAEAGGVAEMEANLEAVPPDRRLVVVKAGENLGFAGGMNLGIRYACACGADYVWLVNNDTVVAPDALTRLVNAVSEMDCLGIAGPLELDYYQPERVVDSVGAVRPWKGVIGGAPEALRFDSKGRAEVELLSGFSMFVNIAAICAVGMMDERFFMYVEDTEWCVRMRRKGWKLMYVRSAKVWHKGSQSTGWGSPLMYYYTTRNQLRLFSMHFPYAVPCAVGRSMLRMAKLLRHRKWSQCKAAGRGLLDWARGRFGRLNAEPRNRGSALVPEL